MGLCLRNCTTMSAGFSPWSEGGYMAELASDEAIARARTAMGLDAAVPARAWRIRRLDRAVDAYYLVVFGAPDAAVAVTTVGAASGEVKTSAHLPGVRPHLL